MNGVMMPDASAGSNHVGASETWTPQVSRSDEAAPAKRGLLVTRPTAAANKTLRRPIAALPPAGYGSRPSGPELISASLQLPVIAELAASLDQPCLAVAPFARGNKPDVMHASNRGRVLEAEADHFPAGVGSAWIGVRSPRVAAGPRVAGALKDPLLQHR